MIVSSQTKAPEQPSGRGESDLWIPERGSISLPDIMKALGDPTRLRIVRALAEAGMDGRTCGTMTPASKQLLSHHIRVLREAGLVECWYEGRSKYARLRFDDLEAEFPGMLASITSSLKHRRISRTAAHQG